MYVCTNGAFPKEVLNSCRLDDQLFEVSKYVITNVCKQKNTTQRLHSYKGAGFCISKTNYLHYKMHKNASIHICSAKKKYLNLAKRIYK